MEFARSLDFGGEPKKRRQVNLTPLIDMMFLLVIFFMLTTSFGLTNLLPVKLEENESMGRASTAKETARKLVIKIAAPDRVFIEGLELKTGELDSILAGKMRGKGPLQVVVETGSGVSVQALVTLLDQLDISGSDVTLAENHD